MEAADNRGVMLALKEYKEKNGAPNYPALFSIPSDQRIAALAVQDYNRVNMLIIGAITVALENINIKRSLNELQVLSLSEYIIETAGEDNLSFEDFMLFLQNLILGKYEMSYESIDIPKFMKLLNMYRDERWEEGVRMRDDRDAQFKGLGPSHRSTTQDALSEHFSKFGGSLNELRQGMMELKKENQTLKQANDFYNK